MATSSPALSNNSTDTNPNSSFLIASPGGGGASTTINASKNLRGLNKPKCIKCGNVARSRCPYQSCKSCCAKAQNPCHIHVLKGNSTLPDKTSSTGSPLFDLLSTDVSPSGLTFYSRNSHRVASLRQLSSNFAQFNNLQSPLRSRKPLTRKEAGVINEWRYLQLKEYKDRNIEAENEAFDRYMQNVSLLEEVFTVNSTLERAVKDDESPTSNPYSTSTEDDSELLVAEMKIKLKSNPTRAENFRNRIQCIVDQGLRKLQQFELNDGNAGLNEQELVKRPKKKSWRAVRVDALTDLIDKLKKARNEEDLKSCLEMKAQLFNQHTKTSEAESKDAVNSKEPTLQNDAPFKPQSDYSQTKWLSTTTINQEALNRIDAHFDSLEEIEDL